MMRILGTMLPNAVNNRVYRLRPGAFPRSTGLKKTEVASRNFLFVRVKNATFAISAAPRCA